MAVRMLPNPLKVSHEGNIQVKGAGKTLIEPDGGKLQPSIRLVLPCNIGYSPIHDMTAGLGRNLIDTVVHPLGLHTKVLNCASRNMNLASGCAFTKVRISQLRYAANSPILQGPIQQHLDS